MEIDLEQARRRAKELLSAARAGDPGAIARLRGDREPRLADAQRAVAVELGYRSWPALARSVAGDRAGGEGERSEDVRVTALSYAPGRRVRIRVRRRQHRYDIDDLGGAIQIAGRPPGWRELVERIVREPGWNISREGVVFVTAVEGRDIERLVEGTARASLAALDAILELETGR
jgi:hypothetical protein